MKPKTILSATIDDLFLRGFADAAGLGYDTAEEQWAGWSRQLTDAERNRIEAGSYPSGRSEGQRFAEFYRGPATDS